ncbi:MAG: tubulin-like doman-containing protein [Candidatus Eremiobacteraeota bacterium]|nr:tubulin-like doman-containing protein [Candidatus Eremiobacteraeota bacterium]
MTGKVPFPPELSGGFLARTPDEESREATLRPTLVIGLGNTGTQVLIPLRKRLGDYYRSIEKAPLYHQFLYMDISRPGPPLGDGIDKVDFVALGVENLKMAVNHMGHLDGRFTRWWDMGFMPPKKDLADGTGGIRQLGRLALSAHLAGVRSAISEKAALLFPKEGSLRTLQVFIVSSACGGTGSGSLVDILFMLHRILEVEMALTTRTTIFLMLPGAFIDKLYVSFKQYRSLHANTYSLFRELDHLFSGGARDFWRLSIETVPDEEKALHEKWKPFDCCYIADNRVQDSRLIPLEGLFSLMGHALFCHITGPVPLLDAAQAPWPPFFAPGFSFLKYRGLDIMKYLSSKISSELLKSSLSRRYDEQGAPELHRRLLDFTAEARRLAEGQIRAVREALRIDKEFEERREQLRAMVPRFHYFANMGKIVQTAKDHQEYYVEKMRALIEEPQPPLRELESLKEAFLGELEATISSRLVNEGPSWCLGTLRRVKEHLKDTRASEQESSRLIHEKSLHYLESLDEINGRISQKKDLSANTDEFFQALRRYVEAELQILAGRMVHDAMESLADHGRIAALEARLQKTEEFLKGIATNLHLEAGDYEHSSERDATTAFFPPGGFAESEALRILYGQLYDPEKSGAYWSGFVEFCTAVMPLSEIFANPDQDAENIFISLLYRYTAGIISGRMWNSAVRGIEGLLPGGRDELKRLLEKTLKEIEPVLLIDGSRGTPREELLWSCGEIDRRELASLSGGSLAMPLFCPSDERDTILFLKKYGPFPLTAIEQLKLCQDHYLFMAEKNRESLMKNQPIKNPMHLEREWNEHFPGKELLFPQDGTGAPPTE